MGRRSEFKLTIYPILRLVGRASITGVLYLAAFSAYVHAQESANELAATIVGTVQDAHGVSIPGAHVALVGQNIRVGREVTADSKGRFAFSGLRAGSYQVKVEEPGVQAAASDVVLGAGQTLEAPLVATRIPVQKTTVEVVATLKQVAQAQVKAQEQQRVFGVLPNYYTSYIWNAEPMTSRLKFNLGLRTVIDPVTFLVVGGVAGVEQWHKTFPGYGQGAEGYAKRYGATYADTVDGTLLGSAILPMVLHQDPRYFYRGSGSVRSRALYAIEYAFICRGDNGRIEPNYSHILGSFAAAGISNAYRAPGDRQAGLTFRNGLIIVASGAVRNLLREFLSRQLTSNVPTFANGKP